MNTLSGILFFVAFLPYIITIVGGQTIPSPLSWAIWASVDTLALVAMMKKKVAVGQLIGAVSGAWIVTVLAILYGKPEMRLMEWIAIAGAVVGIALWKIYGDSIFGIVCSQIAVFVGAFPTFMGAYANPKQEDALSWCIWTASCFCALFAVKKWTVADALQPVTFATIETVMVLLVVVRPMMFA